MVTLRMNFDEGDIVTPVSNMPLPVHDPDSVWIVQQGRLDLFLVRVGSDLAKNARYPVMRVEHGCAVFGVAVSDGRALIVTASPETKLLRVRLDRFQDLAGVCDNPTVSLLDAWIHCLSAAVATVPSAGNIVAVQAGDSVEVGEEPKVILAKDGIVWVSHKECSVRFLGKTPVPPTFESFFPVSKHGWLEVMPKSHLQCLDTRSLLQTDPDLRSLQAFHRIVVSCLIEKQQHESAKERERQRARHIADKVVFRSSLLRLSEPLVQVPFDVQSERECEDPVFLAAEAVSRASGMRLKPHSDMLRGAKLMDPIGAIARASGVRVRRVQLRPGWLMHDPGPLLVFRDVDQRPLALVPHSAGRYHLYDPIGQTSTTVSSEANSGLASFAYIFYRPFPSKKLCIRDVFKFGTSDCKAELILLLLMGTAAGLLAVITPYATGIIFDRLIPAGERGQLLLTAMILLAVAGAVTMFTVTRNFAVLRLQGKVDKVLQAAIWDRLLSLPVAFFRNYTSGDLASRSLGIAQMSRILTGSALTMILTGIFSISSLGLLFYYSSRLAFLATGLLLFGGIVSAVCIAVELQYQKEISQLKGRLSGSLLELLSGIAKFRVAAVESRAFTSWARESARLYQVQVRGTRLSNRLTVFNSVFPIASVGAIFYYHATILSRPQADMLTTGNFVAFLAAFLQFSTAMLLVSSSLLSMLGVVPLYERAQPIFETLPETAETKIDPGKLTGAIEMSRLTFRYRPNMPLVLRDVSATIQPGQFVAFVGASGSGKSTLFRLLLGFETPESGKIYFDGHDLASLDVQAVRRQIGVVLQTGRLISGDIFTNIVGSLPLTMNDAWEAASMVGIDEDIRWMPMGMHTWIGEGGGGLSGGQRQRLLIARAIVSKPRVLLMDEATSALDNQTQKIVIRSLESLQATRVVIAHRLSTVLNADRIFVLAKGTVVQVGTYEDLMGRDGLFRELISRQLI